MKLSEELIWRGFSAETTIKNPAELDTASRKFYIGADPSAESLTIGNLATLMMCATFARHGYEPHLLVGGATGQIGDPKDTAERELKSLDEVAKNKAAIGAQMSRVLSRATESDVELPVLDNLDWFKDMNYLHFLREIGKNFSMTQLLDRQFVQARIGEGGSGISYAEFSYTLIQGYDFLHLFREYGIDMQLCGADQYGNCASGMHLIRKLENAKTDIWSAPLVIDPVSGRKFGKSEGNAIWLDSKLTPVFDYYQFWLGQPDVGVEQFLKFYTIYDRERIENILSEHAAAPEKRVAQKALALGTTAIVHGSAAAEKVARLTEMLFPSKANEQAATLNLELASEFLPRVDRAEFGDDTLAIIANSGLATSKNEVRKLIGGNALSFIVDGAETKITLETKIPNTCLLKRGKNKFAVVR